MTFLIGKAKPQGYACTTWKDSGKVWQEADTFTCAHAANDIPCQRVIHVPPGKTVQEVAAICHQCLKAICPRCAAARCCTPFMKAVEQAEERDYRRREYRR